MKIMAEQGISNTNAAQYRNDRQDRREIEAMEERVKEAEQKAQNAETMALYARIKSKYR
jgi:hypothetical protein